MRNIFELIEDDDFETLHQLITAEPHQLELPLDENAIKVVRVVDLPNIPFDEREYAPIKFAIILGKEKSIDCLLSHARYADAGDLIWQADNIIIFAVACFLFCANNSYPCRRGSVESLLLKEKSILRQIINHFKHDPLIECMWKIIFCDKAEEVAQIALSYNVQIDDLFKLKLPGLNFVHLILFLSKNDVTNWLIQQISSEYFHLFEERILMDDVEYYGFNSLHVVAYNNLYSSLMQIADKINDQQHIVRLLECRVLAPLVPDEVGLLKSPRNSKVLKPNAILLASKANAYECFCMCLKLGCNLYSQSLDIYPDDDEEELRSDAVLDYAISRVGYGSDDRILIAIVEYLKNRPIVEFAKYLNCRSNEIGNRGDTYCTDGWFTSLMKEKRHDLIIMLLDLGMKLQSKDITHKYDSFTHDNITIQNANLLHCLVLMENDELLRRVLSLIDRQTAIMLLESNCDVEYRKRGVLRAQDIPLNIMKLIIYKQLIKYNGVNSVELVEHPASAFSKIPLYKTYQEFTREIKIVGSVKTIIDILLMAADIKLDYVYLYERKKSLALELIGNTIESLYLTMQSLYCLDLAYEIVLKIVMASYKYFGVHCTSFSIPMSQNTHERINPQHHANSSHEFEQVTNALIHKYSKETPPYKIAFLAFRAWRHNQPLLEQDSLARDQQHCRELIELICNVLNDTWSIVKPVFEHQSLKFIQTFKEKIQLIDLNKRQIEKVIQASCEEISQQSNQPISNPDVHLEDQAYTLRFASAVLKCFNEQRSTFRFWNRNKERRDVSQRIQEVAINYATQLRKLNESSPKYQQLIEDLAMSTFTSIEIAQAIESTLEITPARGQKRDNVAINISARCLPVNDTKRPRGN